MFEAEKERLQKTLGGEAKIEHIGSTAVPGLGGKGVIDVLIAAPRDKWAETSKKLKTLGYEYKKKDKERESEKLFFMTYLPDSELGSRIYHVHLTYSESPEVKNNLGFRDYLRSHPEEAEEYSQIKKLASEEAKKFSTKDEMRDTYGKVKEALIQKILAKL